MIVASEPPGGHAGTAPARPPHILFIHPGPVPPPAEPGHSPFWFLSRTMTGDLLTTSWRTRASHRQARRATEAALGRFGFAATLSTRLPGALRTLWDLAWFVVVGTWRAWRHQRYDAVVAYGGFKTGWAGWVVSRVTGARFILELPGHPFKGFLYSGTRYAALKAAIARRLAGFVARRADHLHLLYASQVDDLGPPPVDTPRTIFADFVRLSQVPAPSLPARPFVLLIGYPWYLKGVDVLIRAWRLVADEFPEYDLRVVGHCPDRGPFETLAAGCSSIRLEKATFAPLELIAQCTVLVLPSRTEAMGRVVLEAMGAGKPVIGSAVDGIPSYVVDGVTGLLFPTEDHEALAERLRRLLGDAALRARMGATALEIARRDYSEAAWVGNFTAMVALVLGRPGGEATGR